MGDEGLKFDLGGAASPAPVPLAHTAAFALGPLEVEPALRRVARDAQNAEQIEPLVMQVLIALASARGATLSRDDLIAACWDGRIVSDDAINRVISRLRRILERLGAGAVRLETVAKVGYRLTVCEPADQTKGATAAAASPESKRRFFPGKAAVLAAAVGVIAMAGGVAAFVANREPADITIGVEPVVSTGSDRAGQAFASDLTSDLTRLAGSVSRINLVDRGLPGDGRPDLLVRVSVRREGRALAAQARLVEAGGSVLWSRNFRSDEGSVAELRDRAAIGVAGIIRCGLERSAAKYDDPASRRLFFAACDAVEAGEWTRANSLAQQVVARRPDVAVGWACLAMTTLAMDESEALAPTQREARRRTAVSYARRAIELDPRSGRGYKALAMATDASGPETLALLERGIRADPESPNLRSVYATTLFNAGYVRAGVAPVMRAIALDPMSRHAHDTAVRRLMAAGRTAEAFAMQASLERTWPDHPETARQRLRLLSYYRDAAAAVAEFERLAPAVGAGRDLPTLLRTELEWRVDPASLDRAELDREAEAAYREHPLTAWHIAATMIRMGERERAFAWLARAPRRGAQSQWSLLFWPEAAPLRRDPRFFAAMARLGLVDLWRKRGKWPDFCSEPGLRYDCRSEAARLRPVTT